ncbi:MAG: archaellin/type IV pilin N-terminal domain-containing protein [Candidatus Caldarchaeales archaeon]
MKARGKKAISPVVATVILVAVAIVIAIAVAFWASGLVGVFTRFEKLEVVSAVMLDLDTFRVRLRNTGSADTSIIQVVVQGRAVGNPTSPFAVPIGQTVECDVTVTPSPPPGVTVELAFHSAGGKSYPTAVLATLGQGGAPWNPQVQSVSCSNVT